VSIASQLRELDDAPRGPIEFREYDLADAYSEWQHDVKHFGEQRTFAEWLPEFIEATHSEWLMSQIRLADEEAAKTRAMEAEQARQEMPCYDDSETPF
jgi:hypothetical protein